MPKMSKDLWTSLSGKEQWDIMAAMRGPDIDSGIVSLRLKTLTTAVLRGVMQDVYRVGGTIISKPRSIVVPECSFEIIFPGGTHFFHHVLDAGHILMAYELLTIESVPVGIYRDYINEGKKEEMIRFIPQFRGAHLV